MRSIIKNFKLRHKLYVYLLPAIATICLSISWFFFNDTRNNMASVISEQIDNSSYRGRLNIKNRMKSSQADINFYAKSPNVSNLIMGVGFYDNIDNHLASVALFEQLKNEKKELQELYILSADFQVIASHTDDIFYDYQKDLPWIKALISKYENKYSATIKNEVVETSSGKKLATLGYVTIESKIVGFVVITQDLRVFTDFNDEYALSGDGRLIYTDRNGELLHSISNRDQDLLQKYATSDNQSFYKTDEYTWNIHHNITDFGHLYVLYNATTYYNKLDSLMLHTIVITLGITIMFSVLIWWLVSKLLLEPLITLGEAAHSITRGEKNVTALIRNDEFGILWKSIYTMATELKQSNKQIKQLAYHDDLTVLKNKHAFLEYVRGFQEDYFSENLTSWVVDISNFKQINDIHGYEIGNQILIEVAVQLNKIIKGFSDRHNLAFDSFMIARSAGDEFLIFANMPIGTTLSLGLARSISKQMQRPISINSREFKLSCYIGWEQGGNSGFEVYEKSDMAMHEAKTTNTPILRFTGELIDRVRKNQELSDGIKAALEADSFTLYYQPKCHTKAPHAVNEFEALIRWPTTDGFISPGIFIPFAEEANLIQSIDMWVCERVIKDVSELEELGWTNFIVSFNVSGHRLSDPIFIDSLRRWLVRFDVNPSHIQIEVTEHSLINDIHNSIQAILQLRDIGIGVSLDDFGTGHSSLGYLKDLPISALKIDRCFIQDVNLDKSKKILLKHIIALGQELGLQLVAEGVETFDELQVLTELGCDLIQGYYFFKPLPFKDIIQTFDKKKYIAA
jgi:diguanylate cyclase (GGDEF)-like protein